MGLFDERGSYTVGLFDERDSYTVWLFDDRIKAQNSPSEVEKCQKILHLTEMENALKMHWTFVLEAQMVSTCPMFLRVYSTDSLDIALHSKNLFGE